MSAVLALLVAVWSDRLPKGMGGRGEEEGGWERWLGEVTSEREGERVSRTYTRTLLDAGCELS